MRPAPWLLPLLLVAILSLVWLVAVDRWLRVRDQMLADETASYGPDPGATSARAGGEGIRQRLRPFGAFCYPSGAFCY